MNCIFCHKELQHPKYCDNHQNIQVYFFDEKTSDIKHMYYCFNVKNYYYEISFNYIDNLTLIFKGQNKSDAKLIFELNQLPKIIPTPENAINFLDKLKTYMVFS